MTEALLSSLLVQFLHHTSIRCIHDIAQIHVCNRKMASPQRRAHFADRPISSPPPMKPIGSSTPGLKIRKSMSKLNLSSSPSTPPKFPPHKCVAREEGAFNAPSSLAVPKPPTYVFTRLCIFTCYISLC